MIADSGLVKVLDFGIAKRMNSANDANATRTGSLTVEGVIIGTPTYMSGDARVDIHGAYHVSLQPLHQLDAGISVGSVTPNANS